MKRFFLITFGICAVAAALGYILYRYNHRYVKPAEKYHAPNYVGAIEIIDVDDLEKRANAVIPLAGLDYIRGGAETERTMQRNVLAFDEVDIYPRVLRGVDVPDVHTSILGIDISLPVIVASASFEVLEQIAQRVNKRVPIIFDSGIRRGQHIFKAIASGADVVAIGRPVIYALALGGWMGVDSLFKYLAQDLQRVMWLAGVKNIEEIKQTDLRRRDGCDKCLHFAEKSL